MADSVVTFLLENVGQLLIQEASMLSGVGEQVRSLRDELNLMNEFLENSVGKREKVKQLVSQIQDVAQEAEDVIDTYVVNMAKHMRRNKAAKVLHTFDHASMLRHVAKDIQSINNRITSIYNNREKYGIEKVESTGEKRTDRRVELHRRRREVEENEVVSFVIEAQTVMARLTDQERQRRDVVSIIGMGGLGKTTLAKKIYNDDFIKTTFTCLAFVYVSQEFRTADLLRNILQCVSQMSSLEEIKEDKLVEELNKCLKGKKYLIVLDDVWDTDVWDGIKAAFPDNFNGSRVLITSRVKEVALHASSTPPYYLPFLNEKDSWELFSKKAFRGEVCPPHLQKDGRLISKKCNGLPLAIVVVGGLLAKRDKSARAWAQMAENFSWYINKDPEKCMDILALSYEDLPPYLKACFLYLGVYPEDFEIPARQLIRLWTAEGFVQQDSSRKIEDVAEDYLDELIDRSLIQVARRRSDGGVKSCRIHDLLRDLCILEGHREKFLQIHGTEVSSSSSTTTQSNPRRLSIHCRTSEYISSIPSGSSRVRSLLCFGDPDRLSNNQSKSLCKGNGLLRVLDLGSTVVQTVPTQLEKLIHLRYLRMNIPYLEEIPSSITNLPNLQTLDLRESEVQRIITQNFLKMQQLKHLFVSYRDSHCVFCETENKTMSNLLTISVIGVSQFNILSKGTYYPLSQNLFPNLKKLGLHVERFRSSLKCSLSMFNNLQTLKIIGPFTFPLDPEAVPLSLTKISLLETRVSSSVFSDLAELPNLEVLKLLKDSVEGADMECKEGGFPQLQVLHIEEIKVRKWKMGTGAMQSLRHLSINKCHDFRAIPDQLKQVNTLRYVKVSWCSHMLERSVRELGKDVQCEFQSVKAAGWEKFMGRNQS